MAFIVEKDWTTKAGLRAVAIVVKRGERLKHRCGYVGLPKKHPLHGVSYSQQADCLTREMVENVKIGKKSPILAFTACVDSDGDDMVRRSPDVAFDVHGGLTYADADPKYPADNDGLWWFGFDCAHCDDAEIEPDPNWSSGYSRIVRSLEYVEAECESLAEQIARVT